MKIFKQGKWEKMDDITERGGNIKRTKEVYVIHDDGTSARISLTDMRYTGKVASKTSVHVNKAEGGVQVQETGLTTAPAMAVTFGRSTTVFMDREQAVELMMELTEIL
tara:strand:- start:561 stop:884 length:324 start_codon:yes stop_codon:yes gene_type:complete